MRKKILVKIAVILTICIVWGAMPVYKVMAATEGEHQSGHYTYEEWEEGIIITKYDDFPETYYPWDDYNDSVDDYTSEDEEEDDYIYWNNYEKEISIVIPEMIDGKKVLGIGYRGTVFRSMYQITNIQLPSTIRVIGDSAFQETDIKTMELPQGVTNIGSYAFFSCKKLTSVNLPSTVTEIREHAFDKCYALETVSIPAAVERIGEFAFSDCRSLKEFQVAAGNKNYEARDGILYTNAFEYDGESGEKYNFPLLVAYPGGRAGRLIIGESTQIESLALMNALALEEIEVSSNNRDYFSDEGVLYSKDGTELIACPCAKKGDYQILSTVETVGYSAFSNSSLTSISIPDSVKWLGGYAFYQCHDLESISIGKNIKGIDLYTAEKLKQITISEENASLMAINNVIYTKDLTELVFCPRPYMGRLELPETVKRLYNSSAFSGVDLDHQSYVCEGITEIYLGKDFVQGMQCEEDDNGKKNYYFDLEEFDKLRNLEKYDVSPQNSIYTAKDGMLYTADLKKLVMCPPNISGEIVIADGITSLDTYISGNKLTSLTIPDSVTYIAEDVFGWYVDLTSCSWTMYGYSGSVAEQCAAAHNIPFISIGGSNQNTEKIPEDLDNTQNGDMNNVTEESVKVGDVKIVSDEEEQVVVGSVTMIPVETETEDKPFVDSKVKTQSGSNTIKKGTVLVSKTGTYKVTNVKKKTVTYMGTKNKKASFIKVPEEIKIKKKKYKVTSVSANAFKNNKKIKKVTIGQNVKEIGKNAFRGCKKLETVTIGENVTTIGSYAFYNCEKLNSIEIRSSKLKKVGKAAFKKIAKHPTAKVPKEKIESYKELFDGKM